MWVVFVINVRMLRPVGSVSLKADWALHAQNVSLSVLTAVVNNQWPFRCSDIVLGFLHDSGDVGEPQY